MPVVIGKGIFNLLFLWTVTWVLVIYYGIKSLFSKNTRTVRETADGTRKKTLAFFHPYCNAGGGGERVLWAALRTLQESYPNYHFVIYTGDNGATSGEILAKAKNNFNIVIDPTTVEFVGLMRRDWVESDPFPVCTLLGQSMGSIYLGFEALSRFKPDVYLDTMGYAFTLPLFKYFVGCRVGAYVHYPTISTDMLEKVARRTSSYNNAGAVANSAVLSSFKLWYYKAFAWIYSKAGRCSEVTMVNSSWTEGHIRKLWKMPGTTFKVYPPCDVEEFKRLERHDEDQDKRTINLISVAQFRPEKDHALQIKSMKQLKSILKPELWNRVRLVLLGSVRNEGDRLRVESLKELTKELEVQKNVIFQVNFSFQTLKEELTNGLIGMHSMWNEHFGISVVECMAAGLLMVAHKSGGPLMDIVDTSDNKRNGFLADSEEEYAQVIKSILELSPQKQEEIRKRARSSVDRFSDQAFAKSFKEALERLL